MAGPERAPLVLAFAFSLSCCGGGGTPEDDGSTLGSSEREALASLRYDAGPPPEDPSNRVADDPAARAFGQRLFFDPAFSGPLLEGDNDGTAATLGQRGEFGKVSCAGCHVPETAFVDTRSPHRQVSLAAQWTLRKSPTLLEVAFPPLYNWDGRRDSLWNQALGVVESNREFNSSRLFFAEQLFRLYRDEYEAVFGEMPPFDDEARFPPLDGETTGCVQVTTLAGVTFRCRGVPGDAADYDGMAAEDQELVTVAAVNGSKAMAAYVRTLRCGPSRFDAWLDGDESALDAAEIAGAKLFVGRGRCIECHSGPRLTDDRFHNVGLSPAIVAVAIIDSDDRGAAEGIAAALEDPLSTNGDFSDGDRGVLPDEVGEELEGAFRTPTLRCAAQHPSFMHTGQFTSLEQVVDFFDRGGDPHGSYPGTNELEPLDLSDAEKAYLVAFLQALDGPGPSAELLGPPSE